MDRPRLFLDLQAAQDPVFFERGIPRYVLAHAAALCEMPGVVGRVACSPLYDLPRRLPGALLERAVWNTASEFDRALAEGPLAYHLMSPFSNHVPLASSLPPHALDPAVPLVATLYDLIPLAERGRYLCERRIEQLYRARLDVVASADLVLAISEFTATEAVRRLGIDPARVAAIGAGWSPEFGPCRDERQRDALLSSLGAGELAPFVLTVTHDDPRKNTEVLLDAFARMPRALRRSLCLVVVGNLGSAAATHLQAVAVRAGLGSEEVVFTGRISDEVLRALYQAARLFVFPSRIEGFGLPVLEALACGCPAITSDTSAMPEILDWPASAFDPSDAAALATLLERSLEDEPFRAELERAGRAAVTRHTWARVAERTVAALERLDSRRAQPIGPRRRVALVHTVRATDAVAIGELATMYDVDVFVPAVGREGGERPDLPDDVRVLPERALDRTEVAHTYDCVVHVVAGAHPGPRVSPTDRGSPVYELAAERLADELGQVVRRVVHAARVGRGSALA